MLLIDSGSPLLWVRSVQLPGCGPPPFQKPEDLTALKTEEFAYGSGVVQGAVYEEALSLGEQAVSFAGLEVMDTSIEQGQGCADGILGMDMESTNSRQIFDFQELPHVFSVLLRRVEEFMGSWQNAGSVVLGGVKQEMYRGGLHCVPTLSLQDRVLAPKDDLNPQGEPLNNTAWWQLAVEGTRVGAAEFPSGQAIVDTGTSALIVPRAVKEYIDNILDGSGCDTNSLMQLPSIVFSLPGGIEVSVDPEQYVVPSPDGGCSCYVQALHDAPSQDFYVLGVPFFWKYFVAFDFAKQQVALGLSSLSLRGEELPPTCTEQL